LHSKIAPRVAAAKAARNDEGGLVLDTDPEGMLMDIRTRMSRMVFAGVVWLLLAVPAGLDAASTNPQRGDHPACETDCLRSHRQKMEQTFGTFNREGNYQEYEEQVDKAVNGYLQCIENCRKQLPVK
jgi:hypothetical protein